MGGILNLALILSLVLISFCTWESRGTEGLGHWARITQLTSGGIRIPIQAVLGPYQLQFSTFLRHNVAMRILEIIHVKHLTHWCSVSSEWRSVMIIVYYFSYCVIISYCVFHRKISEGQGLCLFCYLLYLFFLALSWVISVFGMNKWMLEWREDH